MPPSPSSPARSREATCAAILDAASQLIAEKGVDGFTMSEIAQRGRVNRALIYHYFKDRDNLIIETISHIARRYDEARPEVRTNLLEQSTRLHIEHPEIARFIFHLLLTGRPLPALSKRIYGAIQDIERLKERFAPHTEFDPTFGVIASWLAQLSWSFARNEIARHLGMPVEKADERMIAHVCLVADVVQQWIVGQETGQSDAVQ